MGGIKVDDMSHAHAVTMPDDAYLKPKTDKLPTVAYNITAVAQDSCGWLPDIVAVDTVAQNVLNNTNEAIGLGVGIFGVWKGALDIQKLTPSSSYKQQICTYSTLTGGALRIARSVTQMAKTVLNHCKALSAIPVVNGVYAMLNAFVYSLLLIPKVLELIETMQLHKRLSQPEEYATEEESLRVKLEIIKADFIVTEGDIETYRKLNNEKQGVKQGSVSEEVAIEVLKKKKEKLVATRYGEKSLEMLKKLVPEQVQRQPAVGSKEAVAPDYPTHEVKAIIEAACAKLSKSIKVQFALAAVGAAVGVSVVSITFATGGFSAAFFQTVLMIGGIVMALKDLYSFYASCRSDDFKKTDIAALSIALSVSLLTLVIGSIEAEEIDPVAGGVVGSWTLFSVLSAFFIAQQTRHRRIKAEELARKQAYLT